MKVKVLQHHIDEGQKGESNTCAIALAVKEQFPLKEDEKVAVHYKEVIVTAPPDEWCAACNTSDGHGTEVVRGRAELPQEGRQFIQNFDSHESVEPMELELDFEPVESMKL